MSDPRSPKRPEGPEGDSWARCRSCGREGPGVRKIVHGKWCDTRRRPQPGAPS